jgi:hypothetical protein
MWGAPCPCCGSENTLICGFLQSPPPPHDDDDDDDDDGGGGGDAGHGLLGHDTT